MTLGPIVMTVEMSVFRSYNDSGIDRGIDLWTNSSVDPYYIICIDVDLD